MRSKTNQNLKKSSNIDNSWFNCYILLKLIIDDVKLLNCQSESYNLMENSGYNNPPINYESGSFSASTSNYGNMIYKVLYNFKFKKNEI